MSFQRRKIYRFAVHPEQEGYFFLECINDPKLFTQAKSMDEALLMARDVVETVHGIRGAIIELVVPPDVTTPYEQRRNQRGKASAKKTRTRSLASARQ